VVSNRYVLKNLCACTDEYTAPERHAPGDVRSRVDDSTLPDSRLVTEGAPEIAQRKSIQSDVYGADNSGTNQRAVSNL
jgi:hypothetical protein